MIRIVPDCARKNGVMHAGIAPFFIGATQTMDQ
jgi:hypothetical protein